MARTRSNAPVGLGRRSVSLGTNDPRGRRTADMQQAPDITRNKTLHVDSKGRLGIAPSRPVQSLDTSLAVDPEDTQAMAGRIQLLEAKINEMLRASQDAGHMGGGA